MVPDGPEKANVQRPGTRALRAPAHERRRPWQPCTTPAGGTGVPPSRARARSGTALAASRGVPVDRTTTVSVVLDAAGAGEHGITVSTEVRIDLADPAWQHELIEAVSAQATAGARRLRDQLLAQAPCARLGFVPLAALLPDTTR